MRTAYSQITLETNDRKTPPPTNCNLITVFLLLAQANNTHMALFNEARLSGHRGGPCAGCKWKKRRLSFATGTCGSLETKIQTVLRCPIWICPRACRLFYGRTNASCFHSHRCAIRRSLRVKRKVSAKPLTKARVGSWRSCCASFHKPLPSKLQPELSTERST